MHVFFPTARSLQNNSINFTLNEIFSRASVYLRYMCVLLFTILQSRLLQFYVRKASFKHSGGAIRPDQFSQRSNQKYIYYPMNGGYNSIAGLPSAMLERFSIERCKTKIKVINLLSHIEHTDTDHPVKTQGQCIQTGYLLRLIGKESSNPIFFLIPVSKRSHAKPKQRLIAFEAQVGIAL